jgi:hypothetical protein
MSIDEAEEGDSASTLIDVIIKGITLGVIHVLSGVDHVSALCTLSVATRGKYKD